MIKLYSQPDTSCGYNHQENNLEAVVSLDSVQSEIPQITFKDLANIVSKTIPELCEYLIIVKQAHENNALSLIDKVPMIYLFHGFPGVGKTTQAKALAGAAQWNLVSLDAATLFDGYMGTGPKIIKETFEKVKNANKPIILFIDEIDAIGCKRGPHTNEETRRTLLTLLLELSKIDAGNNKLLLVIAATNKLEDLDPALVSRFIKKIELSLPDRIQRRRIIEYHVNAIGLSLSENLIKKLVDYTNNFSGRDIKNVIENLKFEAQGRAIQEKDIKSTTQAISATLRREQLKNSAINLNTVFTLACNGVSLTYTLAMLIKILI